MSTDQDSHALEGLGPLEIVGGPAALSRTDELARKIITPWGGNGLGEIVYLRTYSREIEELGRRERWPETIERVVRGVRKINARLTPAEEDLLREHMLALRGTVSGRALWQLDTALVDQVGMDSLVNCLSGETEVITSEGIRPIRELAGKTVTLMTEGGKWTQAPVRSFGVQPLMAIYLERGVSETKVIRATAEHGWFVSSTIAVCSLIDNKLVRHLIADPQKSSERVITKDLKAHSLLESMSPDDSSKANGWWVKSVEDLGVSEEVFCAIVPETHTFALESNIKTSNCWFNTITETSDFRWIMDRLMVGGGVGFSVERANVYKFPRVKKASVTHFHAPDTDFIVPDTRRGWSNLIERVVDAHFSGEGFTYSTMLVRAAGAPLKTFGGTASGPTVLIEGVSDICKLMCDRAGKSLRSTDILDIVNIIGKIVVSGSARRCLPVGTPVHTQRGLVPIERVLVGDRVLTSGKTGTPYSKVTEVIDQGTQDLMKITTQLGIFECTPKHQVAVMTSPTDYQFKLASEVSPGDRMVFVDEVIPGSKTSSMPSWSYEKPPHSTTCQDIAIPELDIDMAWFIGHFQGDGYIDIGMKQGRGAKIEIPANNDEYGSLIRERVSSSLARFGVRVTEVAPLPGDNCYRVRSFSKQLGRYLHKHVKQAHSPLEVPTWINSAEPNVRASFLAGLLDADGSVKTRPVALVTSIYPNFLRQIQSLYASLGVPTRLRQARPAKGNWKALFVLQLVGETAVEFFCERVMPFAVKQTRLVIRSKNDFGYPPEWVKTSAVRIGRRWDRNARQMTISTYEQCGGERTNLIPIEVLEVGGGRTDVRTYDLSVADAQEFVAAGYLVHNSAQIAIGDPDDALFIKAKRWANGSIPAWRANSNNTLVVDHYAEIADEASFWRNFDGGSEPYGLFNRRLSRTVGRLGERRPDPTVEGINPCGESSLENRGSCNLATIFLPNVETFDQFAEISRILYKIQKATALLPHPDPLTAATIHKNLRLGQNVTGILQGTEEQQSWLSPGYEALRAFDKEWSRTLGVNESIKLTVIQPGGTLSNLPGVTSGIHAAYAHYYIRRVRFGSGDPLVEMCRKRGYPVVQQIGLDGRPDHSQLIVEFPVQAPQDTPIASELSITDQLEKLVFASTAWADQSVSFTGTFRPEELPEIKRWLTENYDDKVKSVSFLPYSDHGFVLAPYEPISKEEYEKRASKIATGEFDIHGVSTLDETDCVGGACPTR